MSPSILLELSDLFTREALEADLQGDADEADRFWDISDEIHARFVEAEDAPTLRDVR